MLARSVRSTATTTTIATARSSLIASHLRNFSASASINPITPTKFQTATQPIMDQKRCTSSLISSVYTEKTYKPFAHYSQAIKTSPGTSTIYLSGQIPADANGNLITGSVFEKTAAIIKNTEAILKEAGSSFESVVKVVVYVKDASIMPEFAKVYDPVFPHRPARTMVEVSALPAGVDIEVDFVAVC
ncbi:RidA family protein [Aspergillus stella-maris]|uniref:RidA family protein n=1 Tax=Aspergillus stella-maris TaxID=1810926 RepID=UPI003CCDE51F